jgi:hypothetical protein
MLLRSRNARPKGKNAAEGGKMEQRLRAGG